MPLFARFKNNRLFRLITPAAALAVACVDFVWMMRVRSHLEWFALGIVVAAVLGALFLFHQHRQTENALHGATFAVLLGAGGFAFILEDARILRVLTGSITVLAFAILLGSEAKFVLTEPLWKWCRSIRPAVLLITVFIIGVGAAAAATFLRVPPTVVGLAAFIPFVVILLADLHTERGFSFEVVATSILGSILITEYLIALLVFPLTFSVVGAFIAIASSAFRESSLRMARGVFTLKFGLAMLALVVGSLVLLLGSSRWS